MNGSNAHQTTHLNRLHYYSSGLFYAMRIPKFIYVFPYGTFSTVCTMWKLIAQPLFVRSDRRDETCTRFSAAENLPRGHKVCIKLEIQFAAMDLWRAGAIIRSLADQTRMITFAFCDVGVVSVLSFSIRYRAATNRACTTAGVYWPLIMFRESSSRITGHSEMRFCAILPLWNLVIYS